jgi:hypothetical protein
MKQIQINQQKCLNWTYLVDGGYSSSKKLFKMMPVFLIPTV